MHQPSCPALVGRAEECDCPTQPIRATVDEMDLTVACPICKVAKTVPCLGLPAREVHLPQRRAKWLVETQQARIHGDLVIVGPLEGSRYAPN